MEEKRKSINSEKQKYNPSKIVLTISNILFLIVTASWFFFGDEIATIDANINANIFGISSIVVVPFLITALNIIILIYYLKKYHPKDKLHLITLLIISIFVLLYWLFMLIGLYG